MTKTTSRIFQFLPAIVFIGNELIRTYLRPIYGQKKYGIISHILGWLPNLLAGFGIITLVISVIILVQMLDAKALSIKLKWLILIVCAFVSLAGLILHEVFQKNTGLHYDVQDIIASIAGVVLGVVTYYFVLLRRTK
ncbi:MAG: hypothetical protein EOP00_18985 [Pedobacter sp.]|nr:MAG: hypothetical protein EOP00_18985 [Pedobacter sp.]